MPNSTDDVATQKKFKDSLSAPFLLLSDASGAVTKQYGGLMPLVRLANRVTFVVGQDGKVQSIAEGKNAVDPTAAIAACPLHKTGKHPGP